jgi:hypothetical protein
VAEHGLKSAALELAIASLPVFPLNGKVPRIPGGLKAASSDPEQVSEWWTRWPEANVGLVTGQASGLLVLDVDLQHGGQGTLAELERKHGKLPKATEVLTGGGGRHLYFTHPGREIRNSAGRLGPGLDVRGDGGYVVAPPSVHASGREYRWKHPLGTAFLFSPPAWLLEDAAERRNGHIEPVEDAIPEGQRREALLSLAGSMRRRGMEEAEMLAALVAVNENRCRPPLPRRELEDLARDVAARYSHGIEEPAKELPPLRVVPVNEFAAVDEPSAEPLLGDEQNTVLSAGGALVVYGDGGAGKTTLELDLVFHLAPASRGSDSLSRAPAACSSSRTRARGASSASSCARSSKAGQAHPSQTGFTSSKSPGLCSRSQTGGTGTTYAH